MCRFAWGGGAGEADRVVDLAYVAGRERSSERAPRDRNPLGEGGGDDRAAGYLLRKDVGDGRDEKLSARATELDVAVDERVDEMGVGLMRRSRPQAEERTHADELGIVQDQEEGVGFGRRGGLVHGGVLNQATCHRLPPRDRAVRSAAAVAGAQKKSPFVQRPSCKAQEIAPNGEAARRGAVRAPADA